MLNRREFIAAEALAGVDRLGTSDHLEALVAARAETLLHLRHDGTVLDGRLGRESPLASHVEQADLGGARVADLLAPAAHALVMECTTRTLETGAALSCVWLTDDGPDGRRSYWEGRFSPCGEDEVLAVIVDTTVEVCRHDADQHVSELSRSMIGATPAEGHVAMQDALRRTAWFVGGQGALMLLPDDDSPQDFAIASVWAPLGFPAHIPSLEPGQHSWLADFLEDLEQPVILAADDIPDEAGHLSSIVRQQDLAGIGLIPLVCAVERVGVMAVGFPALPDRVSRLRFESLGALGPMLLLVDALARTSTQREGPDSLASTATAAASEAARTRR